MDEQDLRVKIQAIPAAVSQPANLLPRPGHRNSLVGFSRFYLVRPLKKNAPSPLPCGVLRKLLTHSAQFIFFIINENQRIAFFGGGGLFLVST